MYTFKRELITNCTHQTETKGDRCTTNYHREEQQCLMIAMQSLEFLDVEARRDRLGPPRQQVRNRHLVLLHGFNGIFISK